MSAIILTHNSQNFYSFCYFGIGSLADPVERTVIEYSDRSLTVLWPFSDLALLWLGTIKNNSAIAGPKPGWERRRGHTDSNMTLHTYSDTERTTSNTREGVLREGSVSPRGMREAMHGADASCSPRTVVAERTLPEAGLSPSGWPSRQAFP